MPEKWKNDENSAPEESAPVESTSQEIRKGSGDFKATWDGYDKLRASLAKLDSETAQSLRDKLNELEELIYKADPAHEGPFKRSR